MVSCLMPLYFKDSVEWFRIAWRSIYEQTIEVDQFVLVVDGPIPRALELEVEECCRAFCSRCKVVRLEQNIGLGGALCKGLDACENELILRMDSDDISRPERLEKMLSHLKPNIDVLGCRIVEFDGVVNANDCIRNVPSSHESIVSEMKYRNSINHVSVLMRKEAVLSAGGYLPFNGFEDYYLWVRMIRNGAKFTNIHDKLVLVRAGDDMIGRRSGLKYASMEYAFQRYLYKSGFINAGVFFRNIVLRVVGRFMPQPLLKIAYKKIMRTSNEKG